MASFVGEGTSGTTHDVFAYDASDNVWNGSAYVAWVDANFTTYRITATEKGTTGRFTATLPANAVTWELRERGATLALSPVVWTGPDLSNVTASTVVTGYAAGQDPATLVWLGSDGTYGGTPGTMGAVAQNALENASGAKTSADGAASLATLIKAKTDALAVDVDGKVTTSNPAVTRNITIEQA